MSSSSSRVLGVHGDGIDQWVLPGVVGGAALAIVWVRLGRNTTQRCWMSATPSRKVRVWVGWYAVVPCRSSDSAGTYLIHFCVMVAAAVWIATRQPRAAADTHQRNRRLTLLVLKVEIMVTPTVHPSRS